MTWSFNWLSAFSTAVRIHFKNCRSFRYFSVFTLRLQQSSTKIPFLPVKGWHRHIRSHQKLSTHQKWIEKIFTNHNLYLNGECKQTHRYYSVVHVISQIPVIVRWQFGFNQSSISLDWVVSHTLCIIAFRISYTNENLKTVETRNSILNQYKNKLLSQNGERWIEANSEAPWQLTDEFSLTMSYGQKIPPESSAYWQYFGLLYCKYWCI